MKIIVIAGAGRKVGKTTTLRIVRSFFPNSVAIKLGKIGEIDKNKSEKLLPYDKKFTEILSTLEIKPDYLLIEGNIILEEIKPDLAIFVDGVTPKRKPDADMAKKKCDLEINSKISNETALRLARQVDLKFKKFLELLLKLNIQII